MADGEELGKPIPESGRSCLSTETKLPPFKVVSGLLADEFAAVCGKSGAE